MPQKIYRYYFDKYHKNVLMHVGLLLVKIFCILEYTI